MNMNNAVNTNDMEVPAGFSPFAHQREFLEVFDDPAHKIRRALLVWHRQSGKDTTTWAYIVKEAARVPGLYYYFFPTYAQGRKVVWEAVDGLTGRTYLDMIPKSLIKGNPNSQELKIVYNNKSVIRIIGTDDYDSIRGTTPIGCAFSEYQKQDPRVWSLIVRPIMAKNKGWVIFNGTPDGPNHLYNMYLMAKKSPAWYCSLKTVMDTKDQKGERLVSDAYLDRERAEGVEEWVIQQEYFCDFNVGTRGSIYSEWIRAAREEGRVGEFLHDDTKYVDTFWDLGRTDDTVIWFMQREGNKCIFIDYYENRGEDISHYIKVLKDKGYKYNNLYLPHDGSNKSLHQYTIQQLCQEYLKDAGIKAEVVVMGKPGSLQYVHQEIRSRFSRFCFNEPLVSEGLKKLELYKDKLNEKTGKYTPVHDWTSHAASAFGLVALAEDYDELMVSNFDKDYSNEFNFWDYDLCQ